MAELDEEQSWINQSQQGDPVAFEALVTRYQRMIHSLTFKMTGSQADAEDLAQEAFIQAFRQLANYRPEGRFSSWLYCIAVNLCLNWKKRKQRLDALHSNWSQYQELTDSHDHRLTQAVQDALMQLNPKQRAAVVLTTYQGMNHAEAARTLGCSETTVSWRLFAARAKLKSLLKNWNKKDTQNEQ